jgi:hypothetical protein
MGFNRIIGPWERLNDECQFLLTLVQVIECTRHSTLVENGSVAFRDRIPKFEPAMGVVKGF